MRLSLRSAVTAVATIALAFSAVSSANAAPPSEDDIAAAKRHEVDTQSSISGIETTLANLVAQRAQASDKALRAQAVYDDALAAAEKGKKEAERAEQQAAKAKENVNEARDRLASVAQAIYQNSAGKLADSYLLFGANSLAEAADRDRVLGRVAGAIDQKVQAFKALQDAAKNLDKRAQAKAREQKKLLQEADVAADEAAQALAFAQMQEEDTAAQRDQLIAQLAAQKNTTKELEAQRFEALEADRKAREAAAAAAAQQLSAPIAQAGEAGQGSSAPLISDSSRPIVDISAWQPPSSIDYDALAQSIGGVILRIGYTGTGSGSSLNEDSSFERHYSEFAQRGVPIGVYWYSCANEGSEGANEARAALSFLGGRNLDLPIYIDVEDPTHQSWASKATLTQQSLQFASVVQSAGYRAGVYASSSWYGNKLDYSQLVNAGMSIWVAQWSASAPEFAYDLWQYSSEGRLNGYSGRLDVNKKG